jgi:Uma2 family endonuclease
MYSNSIQSTSGGGTEIYLAMVSKYTDPVISLQPPTNNKHSTENRTLAGQLKKWQSPGWSVCPEEETHRKIKDHLKMQGDFCCISGGV